MQIDLELYLHSLSMIESGKGEKSYDAYQQAVITMLYFKDMLLSEDEILERYQKKTMQEVMEEKELNAFRYVNELDEDEKPTQRWYDTWAEYIITEKDQLYSQFFAYKIRQIDLLDIDDFMNYQLTERYDGNIAKFSRFLTIMFRKYAGGILSHAHAKTASEWIELKEAELAQESTNDEKEIKIKGRPKRTGDDKLTVLNQEQTVLLIHYLQKAKVFYQGDFLTNKQAGQAFHILTGYSADTIRQKLANSEFDLINTKKNLTDLDNIFAKIRILISNELKDKK